MRWSGSVATTRRKSPTASSTIFAVPPGTRLVVGVAGNNHPIMKPLRERVPAVVVVSTNPAGNLDAGGWRVTGAELRAAVATARAHGKLTLVDFDEAMAFAAAADAAAIPGVKLVADIGLVLAVALAMWGCGMPIGESREARPATLSEAQAAAAAARAVAMRGQRRTKWGPS